MRTRLILPIVLVVATNLLVLAGLARNRQSAEAEVTLTERELLLLGPKTERTGRVLELKWTWRHAVVPDAAGARARGFEPDWPHDRHRPPAHAVYVAFEYDGPAWRAHLARVGAGERPAGTWFRSPPAGTIEEEERGTSRLVAVDLDPDAAALRARRPDRSRAIITRALARWMGDPLAGGPRDKAPPTVMVVEIFPEQIWVPREFQAVFDGLGPSGARTGTAPAPRYEVTLRYGANYVPWIVAARRIGR